MRMIGGLVVRDPADWPGARTALPSMLPASAAAGASAVPGDGSAAFADCAAAIESTDAVWVVADLDLTNIDELQTLVGFRDRPTGLLAALHAQEGPAFIRRLQGAFALALWDRRRRTLVLAVDRLGIKRLYYAADPARCAFASRAGGVLAASGRQRPVDPTAVYCYLNFGFVPAPASIYQGITRLPPGHRLLVADGEPALETYWDIEYREQRLRKTTAAARLQELTECAVTTALRGTTPKQTGAFLSGGTDSSTVVGLMGRVSGERSNAFSVGFREKRFDELGYAALAARHFDAAHYTRVLTADDAFGILPRLVDAFDEPFANNSAIGTFAAAELARECGVTCLLAGDGGDEIFGGNERYRRDRLYARYARLPAILRRGLIEPILLRGPERGGMLGRAQRYVRRAMVPNPRRFYSWEFFVASHADDLLAPEFLAAIDRQAPWTVVQRHFEQARPARELNRLLYLDLKLAIADNDLLKVTRAADLAGVDVRFPLLDTALVEFTGTLPADFKVRGLDKRHLFKQAFRELLPREVLAKPKHGFGVPTSEWLRTHRGFATLARETLLGARARQRGYIRPGAVDRLFRLHADDPSPYYGDILWSVLMLELWHRQHVDGATCA